LKYGRLKELGIDEDAVDTGVIVKSTLYPDFTFIKNNLEDKVAVMELFEREKFDVVVNLAAQAGVRYSLTNPDAYIESNIKGFLNLLEGCRANPVKHFVYASSSSVYGLNSKMPFSTSDSVDHPISLYAASKKANELMAHTYSHLFNIPTTGLRFFTVYGPWGRPDMALFMFTKAIIEGKSIPVFNHGDMKRDFTYIDDIIQGVVKVIDEPAKANVNWDSATSNPDSSSAPYTVYNIGNSSPVKLTEFIDALEIALNIKANRELLPMQPGDVQATWADISSLADKTGYKPQTKVHEGVREFVTWYKSFYKV
jgi:UDP-glucuronate 4-epimerase